MKALEYIIDLYGLYAICTVPDLALNTYVSWAN